MWLNRVAFFPGWMKAGMITKYGAIESMGVPADTTLGLVNSLSLRCAAPLVLVWCVNFSKFFFFLSCPRVHLPPLARCQIAMAAASASIGCSLMFSCLSTLWHCIKKCACAREDRLQGPVSLLESCGAALSLLLRLQLELLDTTFSTNYTLQ
jgi:hypothetical protein